MQVNSWNSQIKDSYWTPSATRTWPMNARWSPYGSYQVSRHNSYSTSPLYSMPNTYPTPQTTADFETFQNQSCLTSWSRPQVPSQYGLTYDEVSPISCASQTPSYLLPSAESTAFPSTTFNAALSPRLWTPATMHKRVTQSGMYPDTETWHSVQPTERHYSADLSTSQDMSTSLTFATPQAMAPTERFLPNPTIGRTHSITQLVQPEILPSSATSYHSAQSWASADVTSGGSLQSDTTISTQYSNNTDNTATTNGTSDTAFSYPQLTIDTSMKEYSPRRSNRPLRSNGMVPARHMYSPSQLGQGSRANQMETYGYVSDEGVRGHPLSRCNSATQHTRSQDHGKGVHTPSQTPSLLTDSRNASTDSLPISVQRTSIASLSNNSAL